MRARTVPAVVLAVATIGWFSGSRCVCTATEPRRAPADASASAAELPPPNDPAALRSDILLRAARNAVAMGNLPEALARFAELVQLAPNRQQARFEYAGLLAQVGRYGEARRELEQLVTVAPHTPQYRRMLADVLLRLREYELARKRLEPLLLDPEYRLPAAVRMAQSLVAEKKLTEAQHVFDRFVDDPAKLSVENQREIGRLLIDLGRPREAIQLLEPLCTVGGDEGVWANLILAHVRLNDRLKALELINQVEPQRIRDAGLWFELATQMYEEQAWPEALSSFQLVTRHFPAERRAVLYAARTHLRLFQVDFAQQLLAQERANPHTLLYSTVLADYHTVVGEYAEAIDIARRRLCADPHDIEAGILLGNTFHAARLLFLADAAYLQTLAECTAPADPRCNEIRRLMARNFTLSRRFEQAIAVLDALLAENPRDVAARLLLVDTLTKARQFDAALAMAHDAPPDDTNARNALALRTQTAYTLLEAGRLPDAAQVFDQLAVDPNCRTPDVAYGLYRTANLLGRPEVAQAAQSLGPTPLVPAAAWATIFAGRASGYCDCSAADCVLDETLPGSPHNVLLLTMRGEAAKQCGCRSGICQSCRPISAPGAGTAAAQAVGWFESALQLSPTNIRARLGLARSDVELLRYGQALAEYRTALKYVPDDINVLREMGRTLDSVQGIRRAGAIYGSPLAQSAQTPLQPMTPPQFVASNAVASPFLPGAEACEPGIVMGQLVTHEYEARWLRNWKDHRAVAWYEQSVCVEPTNEQAYFDLGQANAAINRTHAALDAYGQLLTADPCHRDAATAFNRLQLELRPKTIVRYDYLFQSGRQGLANMTVSDYSVGQRYSLGDENEFVEAGFRQRVLYPTDGPYDLGEIVYSRVQKKVALDTLAFAEVDVERYQYGFTTRPTFVSGLQLLTRDDLQVTLGAYLNNVYANGEAARQNIYRYGPQLDLCYRPTHWWDVTGMYRFANYSDQNSMNEAFFRTGYLLLEGRRRLKALGTYQYLNYSQQSIFGSNPFDPVLGTIHPYFSPRNFSYGTLGLEWKQWLSCDTFKGANELWYLVYAGAGVDSNGQAYVLGNAQINYDITPWLSWVTDARITRADVYNATGISSFLVYRWR